MELTGRFCCGGGCCCARGGWSEFGGGILEGRIRASSMSSSGGLDEPSESESSSIRACWAIISCKARGLRLWVRAEPAKKNRAVP